MSGPLKFKLATYNCLHGAEIRSASSIRFVLDSMGLNGFTVTLTGIGLVRANVRLILTRLDYAFHDGESMTTLTIVTPKIY